MNSRDYASFLRKALQTMYCMDYKVFCDVLGFVDDDYSSKKYQIAQRDFTKWYCGLDASTATKFCRYVLEK